MSGVIDKYRGKSQEISAIYFSLKLFGLDCIDKLNGYKNRPQKKCAMKVDLPVKHGCFFT